MIIFFLFLAKSDVLGSVNDAETSKHEAGQCAQAVINLQVCRARLKVELSSPSLIPGRAERLSYACKCSAFSLDAATVV